MCVCNHCLLTSVAGVRVTCRCFSWLSPQFIPDVVQELNQRVREQEQQQQPQQQQRSPSGAASGSSSSAGRGSGVAPRINAAAGSDDDDDDLDGVSLSYNEAAAVALDDDTTSLQGRGSQRLPACARCGFDEQVRVTLTPFAGTRDPFAHDAYTNIYAMLWCGTLAEGVSCLFGGAYLPCAAAPSEALQRL